MTPRLTQEAKDQIQEAIPSPQHVGVKLQDTKCPVLGSSKASVEVFFQADSRRVFSYPERSLYIEQMFVIHGGEFSGDPVNFGFAVTQIYDDGATLAGKVLREDGSLVERLNEVFVATGESTIFRAVQFDLSLTFS